MARGYDYDVQLRNAEGALQYVVSMRRKHEEAKKTGSGTFLIVLMISCIPAAFSQQLAAYIPGLNPSGSATLASTPTNKPAGKHASGRNAKHGAKHAAARRVA